MARTSLFALLFVLVLSACDNHSVPGGGNGGGGGGPGGSGTPVGGPPPSGPPGGPPTPGPRPGGAPEGKTVVKEFSPSFPSPRAVEQADLDTLNDSATSASKRVEAARKLGYTYNVSAIAPLSTVANDKSAPIELRVASIEGLSVIERSTPVEDNKAIAESFTLLIKDKTAPSELRAAAVSGLGVSQARGTMPILLERLADDTESQNVRIAVLSLFAPSENYNPYYPDRKNLLEGEAREQLIQIARKIAKDKARLNTAIRQKAVLTIGAVADVVSALTALNEILDDKMESLSVKEFVPEALGRLVERGESIEDARAKLIELFKSESPSVAGLAAWSLGRHGGERSIDPLITVVKDESANLSLRRWACNGLRYMQFRFDPFEADMAKRDADRKLLESFAQKLRALILDEKIGVEIRKELCEALVSKNYYDEATKELTTISKDPKVPSEIVGVALGGIARHGSNAVTILESIFSDEGAPAPTRVVAIKALSNVYDRHEEISKVGGEKLTPLIMSPKTPLVVRQAALAQAGRLNNAKLTELIIQIATLEKNALELRIAAVAALGEPNTGSTVYPDRGISRRNDPDTVTPVLAKLLRDPKQDLKIRTSAAKALGEMKGAKESAELIDFLKATKEPIALVEQVISSISEGDQEAGMLALIQAAGDSGRSTEVRAYAISRLSHWQNPHYKPAKVVDALFVLVGDSMQPQDVTRAGARWLAEFAIPSHVEKLAAFLRDDTKPANARESCLYALAKLPNHWNALPKATFASLGKDILRKSTEPVDVRAGATSLFLHNIDGSDISALLNVLKDPKEKDELRKALIQGLDFFINDPNERDGTSRTRMCQVIGKSRIAALIPIVKHTANRKEGDVALITAAKDALAALEKDSE